MSVDVVVGTPNQDLATIDASDPDGTAVAFRPMLQSSPPTAVNEIQPNISGLIAAYDGNSYSGGTWSDLIGSYDTVESSGSPAHASESLNGHQVVEGDTAAKLIWPSNILPSTYTFCHVSRYRPGGQHGRIWTHTCLLYTSPSPRDGLLSRMPSSA